MRVFVTHSVPEDKILEYGMSVAACRFSSSLVSGGGFDRVYSLLPVFVRRRVEAFEGLVYSPWREKGFPWNRLAILVENVRLFRKIPADASVWYYNCTPLNALMIILLRLLKPCVRQQMIILDYTPGRGMQARFLLWLINRMDGTIRLADSPLFTCGNSVCLPGVVPADAPDYPAVDDPRPEFLLSGVLSERISMLSMLLDSFEALPGLTLHITGQAPAGSRVREYAARCPNIHYHGLIPYGEYLELLHRTPFLLSTRDPAFPENRCNFPSKIIEALLHNRIIISSIRYPQLEGIRYFEADVESGETFRAALRRIAKMPREELLNCANQAQAVKRRFSAAVWNRCMEAVEGGSPAHIT